MRIETSVDIDAPPEAVFHWLGDPERAMTWMTSVVRTEYVDRRAPYLVGTTFRETVRDEGGRTTELTGVIVEFVPDERLAFHLEGDYNIVDVAIALQQRPENEGRTRVTQTADVRFKGMILRLASLMFGWAIKRNIVRQSEAEFGALKALCEQHADVATVEGS